MSLSGGSIPTRIYASTFVGQRSSPRDEVEPMVTSSALAHELILGRYRPLRPLGSGGMGHVWLARDERSGLDVALKMIPREGKMAERAEREARAAAALRHPRCQRIYALARDPGHIYIAYEYVPGRTLRQALAAGELGDREAVEVAAQVLEALAHAHGRGIVHRDVKPSNVLLGEGPGDRRPPARLRARSDGRIRHADRDRRRAGDARLHLARAADGEAGDRGSRRLGGRGDALGGARRPPSLQRRQRSRDLAPDPVGPAGPRHRAARPARLAARRDRRRDRPEPGAPAAGGRARRRPAAERSQSGGASSRRRA